MKPAHAIILVVGLAVVAGAGGSCTPPPPDAGVPPPPPPVDECAGYACLACAEGDQCADGGTPIDGTCCSAGDPLEQLGAARGSEVVDIESDGVLAIACGGFGASISDVSDPAAPIYLGTASQRCQRAAFGPTVGARRIFYLTHHGDSWVRTPFLATYSIDGNVIQLLGTASEPGVLYEGVTWRDGFLYVAAHDRGVRVYREDGAGAPIFVTEVGGFDNAWKSVAHGDYLYVADNGAGIRVLSLADPSQPALVTTLTTTGAPRDVAVDGDRLFTALGGSGVDVFDLAEPAAPAPVGNIATAGSAQAVAAADGVLAVAAWTHVAIYDPARLLLLGTERTREFPDFEQDLGVAVTGDRIAVGEWEGVHLVRYHRGRVAPDLWVEPNQVIFPAGELGARALILRNRGRLPLAVTSIRAGDQAFTFTRTEVQLGAGGADVVELRYTPGGAEEIRTELALESNDPDPEDTSYKAGLLATASDFLDVGDPITAEFGFLDPSGAGQVASLRGHVVVLAYFALF